jgi:uncharacterized protein (TIGR00255 family)
VSLSVSSGENRFESVLNQEALATVLALRDQLAGIIDPEPLKLDTLLAIRGIIDFRETEDSPEAIAARDAEIMDGLSLALADLRQMREHEGAALARVLLDQVAIVERMALVVENDPSRSPREIAARLAAQVAMLMDGSGKFDQDRLHAEAALLATKADLREEIDRLKAHVVATRELLAKGGPIGRKLDFLAQEFNRESNTICSKSNAAAVTAAGIELKVVIDQFREQVQNLE